jgi:hypothetical protein
VKCPKTVECIYQTTRRHIQETCYLNCHWHDSFKPNLLAFFHLGEKLACRIPYLLCVRIHACMRMRVCVCVCVCVRAFTCAHAFLYEILTQRLIIFKFVAKIGTSLEAISGTFWFPLVSNKHDCYADLWGGNDMLVVRYPHSCLTFGSSSLVFVIPSWIWIVDFSEQKEPGSWRCMTEMSFLSFPGVLWTGKKV